MFRKTIVVLALAAMALTVPASAQELWQGAKKGDSLEQIRQAFPDVLAFDKPVEYTEDRLALLYLDDRSIGGEIFDVFFIMSGDALDMVVLRMSKDDTGEIPNSVDYHAVEALLNRRYGAPLYEMPAKMQDSQFLRLYKNEFRDGDLTIGISCMFCGGDDGFLGVNYEHKSAAQADEF
ncbi:MAG: hypothetical protein IPK75_12650 [Acidobacteria bacterium]|nr:hypothetical protein [Acidobacteriota bacterium]